LIERGRDDWLAARAKAASVSLDEIKILSPVTTPCRIYCQGANYRRHMIESGMDPDAKLFNMFFTKSDASVASAHGRVTRPSHVVLLDYEIELALIFRRPISSPIMVERGSLKDYVFGIAIANDLSARDVQLPQRQFFKGKSYRGFCPLGPWLTALDDDEFDQLGNLELELAVNGTVRQRDSTRNLVFKPAETISELSTCSLPEPRAVARCAYRPLQSAASCSCFPTASSGSCSSGRKCVGRNTCDQATLSAPASTVLMGVSTLASNGPRSSRRSDSRVLWQAGSTGLNEVEAA